MCTYFDQCVWGQVSPPAARQDDIDVAPANDPIAIVMGAAPEFLSATEMAARFLLTHIVAR